jgi:transcriptional regulator with XRE-family HTH domain
LPTPHIWITIGRMPTLGDLVKTLRKRRGWIQADLAERSGLSVFTISSVEHDKTNYERETLRKLARGFGFANPEELFSQLPMPPSEKAIERRTDGEVLCRVCDEHVAVGTICEGVITGCNALLAELLGYEPHELIGQSSAVMLERNFVGRLARRFASDLPFTQEIPHRRKNGEPISLNWTCYPVITGLGKVTWLGITQR